MTGSANPNCGIHDRPEALKTFENPFDTLCSTVQDVSGMSQFTVSSDERPNGSPINMFFSLSDKGDR